MKTKFYLFLVIVYLLPLHAFSQKEAFVWYFGNRLGLDFNTTPPTKLNTSPNPGTGDTDEAHATICDKNGNFLFYTNGQLIWDKNGNQMPNGSGLFGDWSSTQCATVFPKPGSTTEYYIITTPVTGSTNEMRWNLVDLSLNGGSGDIKTPVANNKNQLLPNCPTYMMESVVSVPHFNGTDIWVICHTADNPTTSGTNEGGSFIVYLVTPAGISYNNSYPIGYAYPQVGGASKGIGIMKSNTCFNRIFISYYNASSRIEGFSFDNSSGDIGNWPAPINAPLVIDEYKNSSGSKVSISQYAYGVEISPNNRYLYVTLSGEVGAPELLQYDLGTGSSSITTIENSCVRLTPTSPLGVRYGQLQMGPDAKIYHTNMYWAQGGRTVSVINSPNSAGAAADYIEPAYTWDAGDGRGTTMGLTSFHKGFLSGRAAITSSLTNLNSICIGKKVDLTAQSTGSISSYKWNIDKNKNTTIDYTTGPSINHTYTSTGTYKIELEITDGCGYIYKSESQVTVVPYTKPQGTSACGNPVNFDVISPENGKNYVWYSDAAGTSPIAIGTTITKPEGYIGDLYLKKVNSASSTTVVVTPGIAAGNETLSQLTNWFNPKTNTNASTFISNTITVSIPLTLNSFKFSTPTTWPSGSASYNWRIKNNTGSIVASGTATISDVNVDSETNNSAFALISPGLSLSTGTYTVELQFASGNASGTSIIKWGDISNTLTKPSIASIMSNDGTTGGGSYIHDISVTYAAISEVKSTTITSVDSECSNISDAINADCPLPVSFISINIDQNKLITWTTSAEINNSTFIIERSFDGNEFQSIGRVQAAGNINSIHQYNFLDEDKIAEAYYRIKQVDLNGFFSYSDIVHYNISDEIGVNVYPNPNQGQFTVIVNSDETSTIEILSVLGDIVYSHKTINNQNRLFVNLSHLPLGTYLVRVVNEIGISITKIIIN